MNSTNVRPTKSIWLPRVSEIYNIIAGGFDPDFKESDYDFSKAVYYECKGYDLIGSKCPAHDERRHFLVKNNRYMVCEIPKKTNKDLRCTGEFYCIIKNLDYGYWIVCILSHKFIVNSKTGSIIERAEYSEVAELQATKGEDGVCLTCICSGTKCCRGWKGKIFDGDNLRKDTGYHTTTLAIAKHFGIKRI